jgi:hypothetical protein
MHTIDLLKGQGIPAKTTVGSVAVVIVIIVVPILAAAGMVDRYMQNSTDIEIKQQGIVIEQATIDKFADAVKFKESLEEEQDVIHSKLSEVSSCLGKYIQWSPVLETLASNMPAEMVMSGLKVGSTSVRQTVASENDPKRMVSINVSRRTLVLDISGTGVGDYGGAVEKYSKSLKSSPVLGPKLEDIEVAQNQGRSGDDDTVSFTMNIEFKSGLL